MSRVFVIVRIRLFQTYARGTIMRYRTTPSDIFLWQIIALSQEVSSTGKKTGKKIYIFPRHIYNIYLTD